MLERKPRSTDEDGRASVRRNNGVPRRAGRFEPGYGLAEGRGGPTDKGANAGLKVSPLVARLVGAPDSIDEPSQETQDGSIPLASWVATTRASAGGTRPPVRRGVLSLPRPLQLARTNGRDTVVGSRTRQR